MLFNPKTHFLVVRHSVVRLAGVEKDDIINRICANCAQQSECENWERQPASIVDDGQVRWTVTLAAKFAHDGFKLMAFVVDADPHAAHCDNSD